MYHRIVEVDSPGTKLRIENGSLKIETAEGRVAHFRTEEQDCVLLSQARPDGVLLKDGTRFSEKWYNGGVPWTCGDRFSVPKNA